MIYEDDPFVERIDQVADIGFETVEFWTWPDKDLDAVETRLDARDLSLAGMAANTEQKRPEELERSLTNPTQRSRVVSDIEESIEVATRLDCPNLIVLVGPRVEGYTDEEMYESVVEGLQAVSPKAESAGVSLLVEPLNPVVDHENYFLTESVRAAELARDVDSPAVGILFDIYHQQITEGNIISNLRANLDVIGHLHVADVPGRFEPGTGELHYRNILSAVAEAGYEGYTGFEFTPRNRSDTALESIADLTM